jgi:hypothetical protein
MGKLFPPSVDTCTGCVHFMIKPGEHPHGGPYCKAYFQLVEAEVVRDAGPEPARLFICLREDRLALEGLLKFRGRQGPVD